MAVATDEYSNKHQFSMVARKYMKIPSDYVRFSERCGMRNLCKLL